jgi:hypothetical protein
VLQLKSKCAVYKESENASTSSKRKKTPNTEAKKEISKKRQKQTIEHCSDIIDI